MAFSPKENRGPRFNALWGLLVSAVGYGAAHLAGAGGLRFVFGLFLLVFAFLVALRLLGQWRRRLLWRLRNQLLVAYVFIAVIPVLLITGMVGLTAFLLYGQLAGYLIASDLESRALQLGAINLGLSAELAGHAPRGSFPVAEQRRLLAAEHASLAPRFPELTIVLAGAGPAVSVPGENGAASCESQPAWVKDHFQAVVSAGGRLYLHSVAPVPGWAGATLCLSVPVDGKLLAQVAPGLGRFSVILLEEVDRQPTQGVRFEFSGRTYVPGGRIERAASELPPPRYFYDPVLNAASKFNVVRWEAGSTERQELPVFLTIATRPSLLNQRIFAPLGEVATALLTVLVAIGVIFLLLEVVSLVTGIRLTRNITTAVNDLYAATQRVQAGDFSVRVPRRRDDQLGALGESFNQMAASIERLVDESTERQRLQDELEVARQVQEQLFPRQVPALETLELVGRCRPARVVSGDYYDFGLLEPGALFFTIGDISGKGVQGALLMATIQSAIRSQVFSSQQDGRGTLLRVAELVARVNLQLTATTSPEKYSSLFVGFYNDRARQLTYTNAGHIPPVLLRRGRAELLSVGGPVVGLLDDAVYEAATVQLEPGDWLVAFTDGLTEVENSYEEEYGRPRLVDFLQRTADGLSASRLAEAALSEPQQWSPGVEPSDDCTVLVAHVR